MSIESKISGALNLDKVLKGTANAKPPKYVSLRKCTFFYIGYNSLKQGCGTRAKFKSPVPDI